MILVKANTKDELLNAKNNNPDKKVYGITSSGNIYFIAEDENIAQTNAEEISQANNISLDLVNEAIEKFTVQQLDIVELIDDDKQQQEQTKNEEQEQPQEVSIEELANNLNDIVDNLQTNDNNDKLEQLEKRVAQLEQTITNLKDTIINDIRIKLSR